MVAGHHLRNRADALNGNFAEAIAGSDPNLERIQSADHWIAPDRAGHRRCRWRHRARLERPGDAFIAAAGGNYFSAWWAASRDRADPPVQSPGPLVDL